MELLGILAIIVGIVGMIVMLNGKRPEHTSSIDQAKRQ